MYKVCIGTKTTIPLSIFWDARLTPTDVLVLGMYSTNTDEEKISQFLGIPVPVCQNSLKNLCTCGYLKNISPQSQSVLKKTVSKDKTIESFFHRLPKGMIGSTTKSLLKYWVESVFQSGKGISGISFEANVKLLTEYTQDESIQSDIIREAIACNHATLRYVIEDKKRSSNKGNAVGYNKFGKDVQNFPTLQQNCPTPPNRREELYKSIISNFWTSYVSSRMKGMGVQESCNNVYSSTGVSVQDLVQARQKLLGTGIPPEQLQVFEKLICGDYYNEL